MTPPQGVFVPFFGVDACTASGLARVALRSGAAVLPGFLVWRPEENGYMLHFGPELTLVRSGDNEQDALANTALFRQRRGLIKLLALAASLWAISRM